MPFVRVKVEDCYRDDRYGYEDHAANIRRNADIAWRRDGGVSKECSRLYLEYLKREKVPNIMEERRKRNQNVAIILRRVLTTKGGRSRLSTPLFDISSLAPSPVSHISNRSSSSPSLVTIARHHLLWHCRLSCNCSRWGHKESHVAGAQKRWLLRTTRGILVLAQKASEQRKYVVQSVGRKEGRVIFSGISETARREFPGLRSQESNCIFAEHIKFLEKLMQHTRPAKPDKWLSMLSGQSTTELSNHAWAQGEINYTLALEERDLDVALRAGLQHPVLIPAESPLGKQKLHLNDSTQNLSDLTLSQLLDLLLWDDDLTIDVQDLSANEVKDLTGLKTCKEVRERFAVPQEQRAIPINCLEVRDSLFSNFPGPPLLESLDFLERLQSDPNPRIEFAHGNRWRSHQSGMARKDHLASWVPGSKRLDRWLLMSEKGAVSKDHVDVVVATWIRCIRGEKIIWFQNGLTEVDLSVWKMADDPREYGHPWAAIRLREGYSIIFPPGFIHVVKTSEDSLCAGGHFLIPAMMDRAITTLKTLEVKPYLTNDNIPVDIFKVISGFTDNLLRGYSYEISPRQLARYVRALEDYDDSSTLCQSREDEGHINARKISSTG
ncbi:hypothetical protein CISG_08432 [Coccidioides immitis RMSCC 3703]|uniref:JmjC domain-containing protein n=2 Tax=Coccidioides immitis TaxID=5501 RepID=A0A0J8R6P1_COCIT|nr:hypothetical protein CIRG_09338 [Coccidioides immitis RMSCC 2394]KMU80090.1 hypothetical protein CISG_08432 [Coccidioides immitis RMSCC 3703]